MTQPTLHPTPRWRDVVLEQVRIVGLTLRSVALVAAVVIGIATVVIAVDIVRGSAATWFDSDEWIVLGLISSVYPFAVWRWEKRFGPGFFWTLPADRRGLTLAKVFAGWVWLMIALALFFFWHLALAAFSGVPDAETVTSLVFTRVTATYLLGSALVLGLRHPLRWVLGTLGVLFLLGFLNQILGGGPDQELDKLVSSSGFLSVVQGAVSAWQTLPEFAQVTISTFLWLGAGLAALWTAASRHAERRRH